MTKKYRRYRHLHPNEKPKQEGFPTFNEMIEQGIIYPADIMDSVYTTYQDFDTEEEAKNAVQFM